MNRVVSPKSGLVYEYSLHKQYLHPVADCRIRHMHPIWIQAATFLPDELVKVSLVFEHVKEDPVVSFVMCCYVGSLAEEMLACGRAAYYGVEATGAVA